MLLSLSVRYVRLAAASNPFRSLMRRAPALRKSNDFMSATLIGAPVALPRAASIAARRLTSGMATAGEGTKETLTPRGLERWNVGAMRCGIQGVVCDINCNSPAPSPLFAASGARSDIRLLRRINVFRLVKPESAETSVILLRPRLSRVRLVKPESGEMSSIRLFQSHSSVRSVNFDSAEMSSILLFESHSRVRLVNFASAETFGYVVVVKAKVRQIDGILQSGQVGDFRIAGCETVQRRHFSFGDRGAAVLFQSGLD